MSEKRKDIVRYSSSGDISYTQQPYWLKKRLRWFEELKFGLFIHWGIYSQWDCVESWPLVEEDSWARPDNLRCWTERRKDFVRFTRDYRALNQTFNPVNFSPELWAESAAGAGMKYVNFTTKHHDGFCMWNTKTTDYRVTHPSCPFHSSKKADIVREVFNAFRAKGFGISCYFSKSDWHSPYYWKPGVPARTRNPNYDIKKEPDRWKNFVRYTHSQIEELMSGYGSVDALWLDGGQVRPPEQDIRMAEIAAMARRYQPGLIMADRTVGGEFENFITPEQLIPEKPLSVPWESCLTMGNSWKYVPNDRYKPVSQLIRMLVEVVSKGGNLLLGAGPDAKGVFPAEVLSRLKDIGKWMSVNGEAIYSSSPIYPYREGETFFTQKGRYVYAIVFSDRGVPAEIVLKGLHPVEGVPVRMLGCKEALRYEGKGGYTKVSLPAGADRILPAGPVVLKFLCENKAGR